MRLSNDDIVSLVRRELYVARGFDADVLADKRSRALDYYNLNDSSGSLPQVPAGRSSIHSADVADTVHSLLAQTRELFQASNIEFQPISQEDESQAQLETDFVRAEIEKQGGWDLFISSAHDAYLSGNGWMKVYVDEREEISREVYPWDGDPMPVAMLEGQVTPNMDIDLDLDDRTEIKVKRTTTTRKLVIDSISPDVVVFSPAADQYDLQELRFVAERKLYTVSELIRDWGMSRDEAMELGSYRDDYWPAIVSREGQYSDSSDDAVGGTQDATQLKECYHCYMYLDRNDNGQYERYHILVGGQDGSKLIHIEPVPFICFVTGSPVPMPHRIEGQGCYELFKEIQDSKTATLRQYVDNLAVMNQSRVAYNEDTVNVEHLTNGRLNGIVACKTDPAMAITPLPSNDIGQTAIQGLAYLDTVRSSRGGASVDMNTAEMQVMKSSAEAAGGMMLNREKMAGWMCNNLVQSLMKGVFILVHKTLKTHFNEEMGAKMRGKWSKTNPRSWKDRAHVVCLTGMTDTERNQKQRGLQELLQLQMAWLGQGADGVITDKSKIYNSAADWIRASKLGNPEEYLVDPQSKESQQAQKARTQQGQMQQKQQMELLQAQLKIEQQKLVIDKYKIDEELKWKYFDTNMDAGMNTQDNMTDIQQERMKAERPANGSAQDS